MASRYHHPMIYIVEPLQYALECVLLNRMSLDIGHNSVKDIAY